MHVGKSVYLAEPVLSSSDNKMGTLIEAAGIEPNLTLDKPRCLTVHLKLINILADQKQAVLAGIDVRINAVIQIIMTIFMNYQLSFSIDRLRWLYLARRILRYFLRDGFS